MAVKVIHESAVEELDLPGRNLRWVVTPKNTGVFGTFLSREWKF